MCLFPTELSGCSRLLLRFNMTEVPKLPDRIWLLSFPKALTLELPWSLAVKYKLPAVSSVILENLPTQQ